MNPAAVLDMLRRHRRALVRYLRSKVEQEDWHGVSDAANDLRELDATRKAIRGQR